VENYENQLNETGFSEGKREYSNICRFSSCSAFLSVIEFMKNLKLSISYNLNSRLFFFFLPLLIDKSENARAHECWDYGLRREELALNGAQEGGGGHILSPSGTHVGSGAGLFSSTSPDVQSLWSFNETFNEKESIE
jgi:hypothetical protein